MKPRKHAELIKQWADDDSLEIEVKFEDRWMDCELPSFRNDGEYRIKPTKPSIDWSATTANYIATDSNGDTYLYNDEPVISQSQLSWYGGCIANAGVFTSFNRGTCDWKESLVRRPEGE